jgi:uroporphyrinogen-III synthase
MNLQEDSKRYQKRRVISFRPEGKSLGEVEGFHIINIPIERTLCVNVGPIDVKQFEAIVFMSEKSVECFTMNRMPEKVYAIGSETALLLKAKGIVPIVPETYDSKSLADRILKDGISSLLVIRSNKGNSYLREKLQGEIKYKEVNSYIIENDEKGVEKAKEYLESCWADYIIFTSSETAKVLSKYLSDRCNYIVISIGPFTTEAIERKKEVKIIESKEHSIAGIRKLLQDLR